MPATIEAAVVIVETERLRLRELESGDLDDLAAILGDAETMRFYPRPWSRDDVRAWIERNRRSYEAHGFGVWALDLKATGELAGDCGLLVQHVAGRDEVEIGYHVKRELWRRGLATEAARAARDFAFGASGVTRVVSLITPENVPSQGVARNVGMRLEKEVVWRDHRVLVFALERDRERGGEAPASPRLAGTSP
jgi:[ribosomal protein S5]-alanine N-acetyltransferase